MKKCSCCGCEKPLEEFAWKSREKQTLQPQCNSCRKTTARESYDRNRSNVIAKTRARGTAVRLSFHAWKETLSCGVCGECDSSCLEFHHLDPAQKEFTVSDSITRLSWKRIMQELRKCVVLCANCHRKVHAEKLCLLSSMDRIQCYERWDGLGSIPPGGSKTIEPVEVISTVDI